MYYYIDVNSSSGYNQVSVRKTYREKLAFFAPDHEKYTWKVMHFGPCNAPTFFTCITKVMQNEATELYMMLSRGIVVELHQKMSLKPDHMVSLLPRTNSYDLSCSNLELPILKKDKEFAIIGQYSPIMDDIKVIKKQLTETVMRQYMAVGSKSHVTGSKVIIDDVILHSTSISLLLLLYECYLRVYIKYRQSFRFDKCRFLSERFEFVGHDITHLGNTTARSKYGLLSQWQLPTTGDGLHSFISLINFYNRFCPLFEVKAKPLRHAYTQYLHKVIPLTEWTPELKQLFEALKIDITSSPIIARYD